MTVRQQLRTCLEDVLTGPYRHYADDVLAAYDVKYHLHTAIHKDFVRCFHVLQAWVQNKSSQADCAATLRRLQVNDPAATMRGAEWLFCHGREADALLLVLRSGNLKHLHQEVRTMLAQLFRRS